MMADVERAQRTSCGRFCSVTGAASCCSTATDAEAAARARKSSTRWMLICPETAGPTERKLLSSTPSSNHGFGETLCRLPESSAGGKMWPTSVGVCATGISGSPAARSPPIQKGRCERRWSVHLRDTAGSAPRGYSERSPDRYPWSTAGTLLSANSRVRSKLGFRRTGHDPGTIVAKPDGVNASTRGRQSGAQLCTDLVKRYGDLTAVDGLDLTVNRGECFGLLGPNGAGKTTTIEIFEGLLSPDAGAVEVLGSRWGADDDALHYPLPQRLGLHLQETQFDERLSVAETLHLFRSFYRRGRIARPASGSAAAGSPSPSSSRSSRPGRSTGSIRSRAPPPRTSSAPRLAPRPGVGEHPVPVGVPPRQRALRRLQRRPEHRHVVAVSRPRQPRVHRQGEPPAPVLRVPFGRASGVTAVAQFQSGLQDDLHAAPSMPPRPAQ